MVILLLIVKRIRVKALVKDKRAAVEAFGTYVEVGLATLLATLLTGLFQQNCVPFYLLLLIVVDYIYLS